MINEKENFRAFRGPIHGDLFSTRRLMTGGLQGDTRPADRRALLCRYRDAEAIRAALERVRAGGVRFMVTTGDRRLFRALGRAPHPDLPQILPIAPNIQGFMRDAVEYGLVGAGIQRVKRIGLPALVGLGLRGVGRGGALLRRDFPTMLLSFIELELADFRAWRPPVVFLQPQICDLALAMDNPRIVEAFARAVRRLADAQPGYMTANFARLVERFERWGVEPAFVIAPWESSGAGMRPDREACAAALARARCALFADRAGRTNPPSPDERAWFAECGVAGALRDDDALLGLETRRPTAWRMDEAATEAAP